jgi:hypothetical protein
MRIGEACSFLDAFLLVSMHPRSASNAPVFTCLRPPGSERIMSRLTRQTDRLGGIYRCMSICAEVRGASRNFSQCVVHIPPFLPPPLLLNFLFISPYPPTWSLYPLAAPAPPRPAPRPAAERLSPRQTTCQK